MGMTRRRFVSQMGMFAAATGMPVNGRAIEDSLPREGTGTSKKNEAVSSNDYRSVVDKIRGPLVPIVPAFDDDERLDLESTQRWLDWIVGSGIPLVWLTYGTSRYFALSDEEVQALTKAVAEVTRRRSLLIAATNFHWPVHQSRRYLEFAADCGADVVAVQCNWHVNPSDDAVFEYYRRVAVDSPLPLFGYTLKVSGRTPGMSNALLKRILGLPQFVGMKNDSGDFYEHRSYLETIRRTGAKFTPLTGGSLMSFLWGHDFGAQAFATGYGIIDPATALAFYEHLISGRRGKALAIVQEREETLLAALGKVGGWSALRAGLVFKGFFASRRERFPVRTLTDDEAEIVRVYLRQQHLI